MTTQPTYFIPHGGGPCFFMDDPRGMWTGMAAVLRSLPAALPERTEAIIVVSGHWLTEGFAFTGAEWPGLIYDYYGSPPATYALRYDVPGAPSSAPRPSRCTKRVSLVPLYSPSVCMVPRLNARSVATRNPIRQARERQQIGRGLGRAMVFVM